VNPLRVTRMLGQDRPLDEIAAERSSRPRVDYWTARTDTGEYRYGARVAAWPGMRIEGFAVTQADALEAAVLAKRRLEAMA
jgi:hypothetical protein